MTVGSTVIPKPSAVAASIASASVLCGGRLMLLLCSSNPQERVILHPRVGRQLELRGCEADIRLNPPDQLVQAFELHFRPAQGVAADLGSYSNSRSGLSLGRVGVWVTFTAQAISRR